MPCPRHEDSTTRISRPVPCGSPLETRRPVAEVAREQRVCAGTLGNWVRKDRAERSGERLDGDDRAELVRLRKRCAEFETEA